MSSQTKSTSLQAYRLLLYRKPLHPELFDVRGRRTIEHAEYAFELWVAPGTHILRFEHNDVCATELITDIEDAIPERGLLSALPCAGEREHEQEFSDSIKYMASVQTEQLPESLYKDTYDELVDFGRMNEAIIHEWLDEENGRCASVVDVQRFRREVHVQAYHMLARGGVVLRSQSIFEHKPS
ncbi:MAG: hypothetical protein AAGB34_07005 [Planctomycetota bacterium]